MSDELFESVRQFVAVELGVRANRIAPESSLGRDLGVDGADGWELMEAFGLRFGVDMSEFCASDHFGPEAGGNPFVWLWWTVTRSWPKLVPITMLDLAAAARAGRWHPVGVHP